MSDDRNPVLDWCMAGGALATLAVVSPPAAATAAVTLGLHQAYNWCKGRDEGAKGPEEA